MSSSSWPEDLEGAAGNSEHRRDEPRLLGARRFQVVSLSTHMSCRGLQVCGLILFRNEMKADSKEVISELREGGISCVICTGDNTITGVSIGRQCGILSENARAPPTRPFSSIFKGF